MDKPTRTPKQLETKQKRDANDALREAHANGKWFTVAVRVDGKDLQYKFTSHDFPPNRYCEVTDKVLEECNKRTSAALLRAKPRPAGRVVTMPMPSHVKTS